MIRMTLLCGALLPSLALAQQIDSVAQCQLDELRSSSADTPVAEIRAACEEAQQPKNSRNSPATIEPYRANYILPVSWTSDTGNRAQAILDDNFQLDNIEIQFQISLKYPVLRDFLVHESDLWFSYTMRSFWQAYNSDVSRPFRETNHEPELIWEIPSTIRLGGFRNQSNALILNHQSNGQSGSLSRSWNRVMIESVWRKGNLRLAFKPWVKLSHEITVDAAFDEENPDIVDYMGHFELHTTYRYYQHRFTALWRNNFKRNNRGAIELGWSFPLNENLNGLVTYFNGFGESLIDYNHSQQRLSLGIQVATGF